MLHRYNCRLDIFEGRSMSIQLASPFATLLEAVSDDCAPLDRLVRAAEILSRAANDVEMVAWCEKELNGYPSGDVPDYRKAAAMLQATDSYGRTLPVYTKDANFLEAMAECRIFQSLSAMKELCATSSSTEFKVLFPPDTSVRLLQSVPGATEVFRVIQANAFRSALAGARQFLFNWALRNINSSVSLPGGLSMTALVGVPSTTSAGEPARMLDGPIGLNVSGQVTGGITVQLNSPGAASTTNTSTSSPPLDSAALKALADAFGVVLEKARTTGAATGECADLEATVKELNDLAEMEKPHASWLRSSLLSAKAILENTAGGVLAELAKPYAVPLLAHALRSVGVS